MAISGKRKKQFEYVNFDWLRLNQRIDNCSFDKLPYAKASNIAVTGRSAAGVQIAPDLFTLNYKAIESKLLEELFRGDK